MKRFEKELQAAKDAAREAGLYLNKRDCIHVDSNNGKDIKLSADKESERIIISSIESFGYSILSEEYGLIDKGTKICWIVDPLDGTMNYYKGLVDLSCVSIALWNDNIPILGVVYNYRKDELFWGLEGQGSFLNGNVITPSKVRDLSQAVLGTGFPLNREYDDESLMAFIKDIQRFKKIRMLGTAALMATFVACGRIDVYMEENG